MQTQAKTVEQVLEEGEQRFPEIVALYKWSLNYHRPGEGPMTILLDLIGYTVEEYGETLYDSIKLPLGYLELDYLGDALKEYATRGEEAYDFVVRILKAEMGEER